MLFAVSDWEVFFGIDAQTPTRVLKLQFLQATRTVMDDVQNVVYLDSRSIICHRILLAMRAWSTWHPRSVLWWMQLAIWGLFRACFGRHCRWIELICCWTWRRFTLLCYQWFLNFDDRSQGYFSRWLILLRSCGTSNLLDSICDFVLVRFFRNWERFRNGLLVNTGHLLNWFSEWSFRHRWLLSVH